MTRTLRQIAVLCMKDLRIEARGRQTISLVVVLGVLIIVVLGLGLGGSSAPTGAQATAILWVAYLFGGVLVFEKTMAVERHDGALAALLLAPVDRGAIYLSKLISNLVLMLGLAAVITPVAITMFRFDISMAPGAFFAIMGLSFVGFAAVGTLFAASVSSSRLRGGMLAIVVFPVCLPLVITSTQMMGRIFRDHEPVGQAGYAVLVAFALIYLAVSWITFELTLEP